MKISPRALAFATFGVGPLLLLAGCGGTSEGAGTRATLVNIQPTSYTELPPETTTTTTTTVPGATLPEGSRSPIEQSYVILAGDSLAAIAGRFDITLDQLVNYNQFANGLNELLLPGDEIKIPPDALVLVAGVPAGGSTDTATDSGDTGTATDDSSTSDGCTHVIVAGENPSRVANKYDIEVEQLYVVNPGGVMDTFLVGAVLNIPPGASC